ncbi:MAG TPA: HAD-IIA family hydrolase [Actinomycetota bacterium]|nr:HAD-IIA family hydrolase [Actinomycetota bacterium]
MSLAERYDCFLLDLDGVVYRGDRPVEGAPEAVARLRAAGRRVVFVTNNSSLTPPQVAEKLGRVGVPASPVEVVTSALATADLLASRHERSAFVIGEDGIREALAEAGIEVLDGEPERVDSVVIGWDREVDYAKLRTASILVQRGAALVATNADISYPAPDGLLWPGAGAILLVVTTTTGVQAEVVGKPGTQLFEAGLRRAGGGRPLVVGDRIDTDVAGAAALGWDSLLVLTGISPGSDLESSDVRPTYVARDLAGLFEEPEPRPPGAGS